MPATPNEQVLIKKCCSGDRVHQRILYDSYAPKMMVVAMRYAASKEEAEDILQDAFVKIFNHLKEFQSRSTLGTWMSRIVINTALNHLRNHKEFLDLSEHLISQNTDNSDSLSGVAFDELISLIQKLPAGARSVFNLYAIEGYGHKEIAKMIHISIGTSKSQYARARHLLQQWLAIEEEKTVFVS